MAEQTFQVVKVPQENISDTEALLVQWHFQNGAKVKAGELVVCLETSKSTFDVESPVDGFVFYDHKIGDIVEVGKRIFVVAQNENFTFQGDEDEQRLYVEPNQEENKKTRFSKSALRLVKEKNIDKSVFAAQTMVTREDVLVYLNKSKSNEFVRKEPANNKILIFGGGGHAKICIDIIRSTKTHEIVGIIEKPDFGKKEVLGVPVVGSDEQLMQYYNQGVSSIVNGLGLVTNHVQRQKVHEYLKSFGFYLPNIIHPRASVEPSVILGEGIQIMANATVGSNVTIGDHCIINSGAIVCHDSVVSENVHISPGAILAGGVQVGKNSLIGMGSTIYLGVIIGDNVVVYNGCNVMKHVSDGQVVKQTF